MLHEEVDLKWEEMQAWVQDFQLLERLRADLVVGVSINQVWYTQWTLGVISYEQRSWSRSLKSWFT
jgi:hypothetical protein